jgi:hypothetical protein
MYVHWLFSESKVSRATLLVFVGLLNRDYC